MPEILDIRLLANLEPLASIGQARLREVLEYCHLETAEQGFDPFKGGYSPGQSVYLLRGELGVEYADGSRVLLRADSEAARHPIGKRQPDIVSSTARSRVHLLRVDDDLLDRMITWDQFVCYADAKTSVLKTSARASLKQFYNSGMFSAENLSNSRLAHLPPANFSKLLTKIESVQVWDKEVIFREGDEGVYYYLIESGRAQLTRRQNGAGAILEELQAGVVFGEDALCPEMKRNATVTMKSNGVLLRLKKHDFFELMEEPSLNKIIYQDAKQKIAEGAVWLDVRHPPEFRFDRLPNAINVPLNIVRDAFKVLHKDTQYIAYCQSGRRSAAAAFLLAQAGYRVDVLANGLWSVPVLQQ